MFSKLLFLIAILSVSGYKLKQVIVLSRHNIRTPWKRNLHLWSSKQWPVWNGDSGDLTAKGRQLEFRMGKYFSEWMIENNLLENNCPGDQAFIYANTRQRTKESAKAFAEGAFGDCVDVYVKNTADMDPIFNPIIRNTSTEFREYVTSEMKAKLISANLRDEFSVLNRIIDFGNSTYCRTENVCDLSEVINEPVIKVNKEPIISGAFSIACVVVDAFLMAYYEGLPAQDVGWGEIHTQQWSSLSKIFKSCFEVRLKIKQLDKDVASTLLKYLSDIFKNGNKKFYLLMGHDVNIYSLMSALKFKDFTLHNQHEATPIGSKLVFQRWFDEENERDLLKVSFVYHSSEQIRDGVETTLQTPPQWETLEMEKCLIDKNGFCLWNDFVTLINE